MFPGRVFVLILGVHILGFSRAQKQENKDQCPCIRLPDGSTYSYDSRYLAIDAEEAAVSFPDLSMLNPPNPVDVQKPVQSPALAISSAENQYCTTEECMVCQQDIRRRLEMMGLLSGQNISELQSNNVTCNRYLFTQEKMLNRQYRKQQQNQNSASSDDSDDDNNDGSNRKKKCKRSVLSNAPEPETLLQNTSMIDTSQNTSLIGTRFNISCSQKGVTMDTSGMVSLCSSCWVWRRLPTNYFPQFINELICDETDQNCLSGYAACEVGTRTVSVLRNDTNGIMSEVILTAGTYCECKIKKMRPKFSRLIKRFCGHYLLLTLTVASVFVGLTLGFILRPLHLSEQTCLLINFPGEIFMQILKMMILPLIFSSLVSALAQMDWKESGQMGLITLSYYLVTALLATIVGIVLVLAIRPGDTTVLDEGEEIVVDDAEVYPLDTFLDLVRNLFPDNILQATFQRIQTKYVAITYKRTNNSSPSTTAPIMMKKTDYVYGTNILGVLVFCTGFGMAISKLGERAALVVEFFIILDAAIMRWIETLMWFAPVGIVCLITGNLLELDDLSDTARLLFKYLMTVIAGLLFHTIFIMPALYFIITRKNPLIVAQKMLQALATAFGTASSGAALPLSMQCMEDVIHVDRRVTRFVLPLGTTINMDGNALYEAVAVIFIAQLNHATLTMAEVITISLTATVASIGMGSVPAGLVSILFILSTVGLPSKDVPLLLTVDWLLDRLRTMINVLGDCYVAGGVAHILHDKLTESDEGNQFRAEVKEGIEFLKKTSSATYRRESAPPLSLSNDSRRGSGKYSLLSKLSFRFFSEPSSPTPSFSRVQSI